MLKKHPRSEVTTKMAIFSRLVVVVLVGCSVQSTSGWVQPQRCRRKWVQSPRSQSQYPKLPFLRGCADSHLSASTSDDGDKDGEAPAAWAVVVDPMDHNGRSFMVALEDWGVSPVVVLSPGVVAALEETGDNSLSHLAAPQPGKEVEWAAERGLPRETLLGVLSGKE